MRARRAAVSAGSVAIAAIAIVACRLTGGLTGGELPDAAGEGGPDGGGACDADLASSLANCGACGHVCATGQNGFAACSDGGCVLSCATGYGDCDEAGANGCEVNLLATGASCGRCGHDCLNPSPTACRNGLCVPYLMSNGTNTPVHIVEDDVNIYGINANGRVTRISKNGGALADIVQGDTSAQSPPPRIAYALSGDAGALYFTGLGDAGPDASAMGTVSVVLASASNVKGTVLATTPDPYAVDATQTYVYWSEGNPETSTTSAIKRCKLGSCVAPYEPLVPTSPGRIESLRVKSGTTTSVIWTNAGTPPDELDSAVYHCDAKVNCAVQPYVEASKSPVGPFGLTFDGQFVFFTTLSGAVGNCSLTGCGGAATVLDQLQLGPRFIAVEGTNLFWTNGDGTIKSIPKNPPGGTAVGANERVLYENRSASPWDIVVDPDAIYWTDLNGSMGNPSLFKLAR